MRRGQVRIRTVAARSERREQVLDRVDRLVRGMEAVAQRLSSDQVSSTQRSVLVSRFNDLQRRVNQIDVVVGSEGHGDAVVQMGAGPSLGVETPEAAEQTSKRCARCGARSRPSAARLRCARPRPSSYSRPRKRTPRKIRAS